MAYCNVQTVPSNTCVTVQDANNININVHGGTNINLEVVPTPTQVIQINRGVAGKLILMRPEKPAPFTLSMARLGSLATAIHDVSSITKVNEPVASTALLMVSGIAVGVGV